MVFTDYEKLWEQVQQELPGGGIVAISGYGGSGKTQLGIRLGRDKPGAQLIHVDDYLNWPKVCELNEDGQGVDFESIVNAHITPFKNGTKPVKYLIIEGIKLFKPGRQELFDFRIWIDIPLDVATSSGQARDKEQQELWTNVWASNELAFEAKYNPRQYADAMYKWTNKQESK